MVARITVVNDVPPDSQGRYVLYWMIGARRSSWNFALDRAVDWARRLGQPLLVLEGLRSDYPWASDRLHRFVLDGMHDNAGAFEAMGIGYYPFVEQAPGQDRGLLAALASQASVVVTDRSPVFELPAFTRRAVRHVSTRFEQVDGCGMLPVDAPPVAAVYPTAYAFRRHLQRVLHEHIEALPAAHVVTKGELPPPPSVDAEILRRWPPAGSELREPGGSLASLPIDHAVQPTALHGGETAGRARLTAFVANELSGYGDARNHPDDDVGSTLSPYLHFGHVSAHEVVTAVLRHEDWRIDRLSARATGAREGWWGVSAPAEAFLDQVVTWRELGFNMSARRPDVHEFDSLPPWAIATLAAHANDQRPHVYTLEQFARAETHDPLWNAAQRQLLAEGRVHNYLRMLWGKKILEWSASPRQALSVMIELNNRFALDGRDPNSYSGIFWVLGRYDRPWPERPIYGTVRCMTSASTAKKLRVKAYLRRFGGSLF